MCITDVRFPNEVKLIHSLGGKVIRIEREGFGPANNHVSETAVDGMEDINVSNNGAIDDFCNNVEAALTGGGSLDSNNRA